MSLQYVKKEVRNGIHFLHADKHQSLKVGIIVFDGNCQTCPKYPKQEVRNIYMYIYILDI